MVTQGTVWRGFTAALTRASGHGKTQQTGTRSGNRAPRIFIVNKLRIYSRRREVTCKDKPGNIGDFHLVSNLKEMCLPTLTLANSS